MYEVNGMKKWVKRIGKVLVILFLLISIIPYLIPVPLFESSSKKPFKESEFFTIEDTTLHYRTWIPEKEIVGKVLMVHGLGGSTFTWRNNAPYLYDQGYVVVTADLPGFGYSDKSTGIDHSQKNRSSLLWSLLEDIDSSLDTVSKQKAWTLVGHSMGGGAVSAMSMENPTRTNQLVLVSGALFDNNPAFVSGIFYYSPIKRIVDVLMSRVFINEKGIGNFLESACGVRPTQYEIKNYLEPLKLKQTPSFISDLLRTAKNEEVEKLNDSDMPILFIAGKNDTWVSAEQPNTLKSLVPRVKIQTIDDAAHCVMETNSIEFNQLLFEFLKDNEQ